MAFGMSCAVAAPALGALVLGAALACGLLLGDRLPRPPTSHSWSSQQPPEGTEGARLEQ